MYRPENCMLNRATSSKVFDLALMPNWFSAIQLKRQYVFNRAKLLLITMILASGPLAPWRFRPRTLPIGMTVAAIGLGWIVYALGH